MKNRKKLMDEFIKEKGEKIFELFYDLMKGEADVDKLKKIINLYEIVLKILYKEMFLDALKLGFVLKNILY